MRFTAFWINRWLENIIPRLNPIQVTEGGNMLACKLEKEYSNRNLSSALS
ncbi:hypothetical protein D7Z94_24815 [Ulvibacterium marinum]|uniref:Uncharacterized protein n=1 Tax=Ulvibacterium marinum TaxID=2419782 RepID=A0A3B0BVL6_9FLAO|nr:hypothetical protein D7Z94_24815 [Ulvibacterium marinum]